MNAISLPEEFANGASGNLSLSTTKVVRQTQD
jgi:hypothetical protein